ncbi:MAG: hypothetical protein KDA92_12930, partial [Planctomycetales bacterium]|nr:hypothetical protein [Planctomycetales bacterium]
MRKSLSSSVRVGTVLVICGIVPFANGCRSTRSSISGLPGLAWVAPSDEDAKFGGWSEDDSPSLPPPSSSATPQLASKSGTTSLESSTRRAVATGADSNDKNAYAQASYPDTGYDNPYESSAGKSGSSSTSRAATYSTGGNYDAAARVATATSNAAPRRGFYSDDYPDEGDTASADSNSADSRFGGSRYGDDESSSSYSSSSSSSSSRYADDSTYGRYGETDIDGNSRNGN